MNQTNHQPIKTLAWASGLSLAGTVLFYDCLFQGAPLGTNVPIFFLLFYAALLCCYGHQANLLRNQNYLLVILGFAFSLTFALYNNPFLLFLNGVALLYCTALQLNLMLGLETYPPFSMGSISNICYTIFVRPFHRIGKALTADRGDRKTLLPILMALLILIPVLGIFLFLLSSADQVFSELLRRIFRIESIMDLLFWVLTFFIGGMLLASLFTSLIQVRQTQSTSRPKAPAKFNLTATAIVLAGVSLLMLAFCLIQGIYLFGSAHLPNNLSYSEYARQGFFQLCAAAMLIFALVALCRTCTRDAAGGFKALLNALYTLLMACTLVLVASSFYRLMLYEQAFSYTRLRIYVQAFLILLGILCLYYIAHIWHAWKYFRQIAAITSLCALLGLSYFNVDAFIAKQNTKRLDKTMSETGEFGDLDYLLNLSIDALPYYLDVIAKEDLEPEPEPDFYAEYADFDSYSTYYWERNALREKRCHRLNALLSKAEQNGSDLRYWNLGREVPSQILAEKKAMVEHALSLY